METEEPGVSARGVVRRFGSVRALDRLDLTAPYGEITALVGPNGAGKTTLLLILATLLAPDEGEVRVGGFDVRTHPEQARASLGWMPDAFGVYDQLTVGEYLSFFAEAYRLPRAAVAERVSTLLALVHLGESESQPVHALSRGQKQRLGLARSLVHHPRVLLLDEPASGLDPRSRIELRDVLRGLAADGVAVLVSSHILSELEEIADRIVLVDRGQVVGEHLMTDLASTSRSGRRIRALDHEDLVTALAGRDVESVTTDHGGVEVGPLTEDEAAELLAGLIADGVRVVSYVPAGSGLESAYLEMTEERR